MTYNELTGQVSLLCSTDLELTDDLLLSSANMALRELYTDRVITRTVNIAAKGLKPVLYYKQVNCANGGPFQVKLPGYAYSFRIRGSCQMLTITPDGSTLTSITTGNEARTIKATAMSGTSLRFFGTYSFTIYDFSVYKEMFSRNAEDIPDPGETMVYNVRDIYEDYMSFTSPATDSAGNLLKNCVLQDGTVRISSSYNGEIVINYRRLPTLLTGYSTEHLDVPDEYLQMYVLLVAYYRLLSRDELTAKYYKSRYNELLQKFQRGSYPAINTGYENINNWA